MLAGALAGSVALVAFGLDSAIEGLASVIVVWRFTGSRTLSQTSERTLKLLADTGLGLSSTKARARSG